MALRINTNIAAMNAHKNMIKTDNALSESLGRLSSGLRINKAADDASGMAIADSLRSQALGLGQAIKNGNDGISIVQTADAALEESINIVNTIKQKSIQSAQDGQTTESRKAIQADISKLRDELDTIAKTTAFNNQKLLSGNFTDKKFQIGAYAGETVDISIQSTEATKIGHVTTSDMTFAGAGVTELNIYSNLLDETFSLNTVELAFNNDAENGVGAVADAINKLSDVLGISATASVATSTEDNVAAGTTDSTFAINGVTIGALDVSENDSDGALVAAINNKTSEHGVTASVDQAGILTMTATDSRAIEVTMDATATQAVMGGTVDMSTLGKIEVRQEGTSQITITDASAQEGIAVSTEGGSITVSGAVITTQDAVVTAGSTLTDTFLGSGTVIAGDFTISGTVTATTDTSIVAAGSTLASGTVLESGTTLEGSFTVSGAAATTASTTSTIETGSLLKATTALGSGTVFEGDVSASLSGGAGNVIVSGTGANAYTRISGTGVQVENGTDLTLTAGATLAGASTLADDSVLTTGSMLEASFSVVGDTVISDDMTIKSGTVLADDTILQTGSFMNNVIVQGDGNVAGSMTLKTGSTLGDQSILKDGSSLGSTVVTVQDLTVGSDTDMLLGVGTIINSGSTLTAGTVITNKTLDDNGTIFEVGSVLAYDIKTDSGAALTKDMIIKGGSILLAETTLAANDSAEADGTTSSLSESSAYRLSDVDVTTQEGAQIGIAVADAALKALDKVRSDLGSVQNQLTSTIANISTTQINVSAAESTIRDVDFAAESANFTKMQVLSQAGTFAMSQANATSQNVLSLLQ